VRGYRDLSFVSAAAVVLAAVALLLPWEAVRALAATPLALLLPGYAVTAAAFGPRRLDRARLGLLTVAMSLSVLVLCTLVLNYVPGGIRDVTWALILVVVVLAACRGAAIRRRGADRSPADRPGVPRLRPLDAGLLGGGLLAAVAALVVAATVFPAGDAVGYTRLWMLPSPDGAGVRVGVANNQQGRASYRLLVRRDGRDLFTRELTLEPGEERAVRVSVPAAGAGASGGRVAASLYRAAAPRQLYRRVTTWLRGGGAQG
jgi:uncharacterized membrane protein